MGCSETKNTLPNLLFTFEPQNQQHLDYCNRLKNTLKPKKSIKFEIRSFVGATFSIQLKDGKSTHVIQDVFDENQMEASIQKIYQLLGEQNNK